MFAGDVSNKAFSSAHISSISAWDFDNLLEMIQTKPAPLHGSRPFLLGDFDKTANSPCRATTSSFRIAKREFWAWFLVVNCSISAFVILLLIGFTYLEFATLWRASNEQFKKWELDLRRAMFEKNESSIQNVPCLKKMGRELDPRRAISNKHEEPNKKKQVLVAAVCLNAEHETKH